MAVADRTFSFRAQSDFTDRIAQAEATYARLSVDPSVAAHVSRELEVRLARRLRMAKGSSGSGRVIRAVTEAFVEATEQAQRDLALAEELRAFDGGDRGGDDERAALLARSAATDA